jgi:PhzF family phenazine biosynthesis protein
MWGMLLGACNDPVKTAFEVAANTLRAVQRPFAQVDVFTTEPYRGNPVAVVLDGSSLSDEEMQRIAHWTNLSETTFVLAPTEAEADYRVRIFTPSAEFPFAGHPTLGTCHAWLASGGRPRGGGDSVVQECGAGLVRIRRSDGQLAFAAPPLIRGGDVDEADVERIARLLGIERSDIIGSQWADNGPGWVAVMLRDAEAVLALRPGDIEDLEIGVVGRHPDGGEAQWELRAFMNANGMAVEDPVTGSLHASVAQWLLGTGQATAPYVAAQGTVLGRRGRANISQDEDGTIWVGGGTVTCVSGQVELPG